MLIQPKFAANNFVHYMKDGNEYEAKILQALMVSGGENVNNIFAAPVRFDYIIEYFVPIDDDVDVTETARVSESELTA